MAKKSARNKKRTYCLTLAVAAKFLPWLEKAAD
jgi:hypothetical protein